MNAQTEAATITACIQTINHELEGKPYTGTTLDAIQDAVENALVTYSPGDVDRRNFLKRHDYGSVMPHTQNECHLYHDDQKAITIHFELDARTGIDSMRFGRVTAIVIHTGGEAFA